MHNTYNTLSDLNELMYKIGCFDASTADAYVHNKYLNESMETEDWHPGDRRKLKQAFKDTDHNVHIVMTSSYAILYNASNSSNLPSMIEKGPSWEFCNKHAYGKGVYCNFQEYQAHNSAWIDRQNYGDTLVKYRYNGNICKECLVFEPQLWGKSGKLSEQLKHFEGLEDFFKSCGYSGETLDRICKSHLSSIAVQHVLRCCETKLSQSKGHLIYHKGMGPRMFYGSHCDDVLMHYGVQGMLYMGDTDGPVAIIFNTDKLDMLAYYKVSRKGREEDDVIQWTKVPEGKGTHQGTCDIRDVLNFFNGTYEANPMISRPYCGELLVRNKRTKKWVFLDMEKAKQIIYNGLNDTPNLFGNFEFEVAQDFSNIGRKEMAFVQLDKDEKSQFLIDKEGNLYREPNGKPFSNIKTYYPNENEPINNEVEDDTDIDFGDDEDFENFKQQFGESIKKNINKFILNEEIVRPLVNNMMSILGIIDRTWKSPDDLFYIHIDQRYKDFRNFNKDRGFKSINDRGAKRWKQEDPSGKDSTRRENHVGHCIIRGRTKEDCKQAVLNATVHLNPWAAKLYGKDTIHSNGGMEAIIEICHRFYARAYMVINPRSMQRTLDRAREDKKTGLFRGREFVHRAGQSKSGFDGRVDWNQIYPDALIDCDISDPEAWKDVKNLLQANGCQIYDTQKSHQGIHFIVNYKECENIDFTPIMNKYPSFNKPGDPAILLKHDANFMAYSPAGIR